MKTYNATLKTQFISWETYNAKRRIDNGEDRFETYENYEEHYSFETEQDVQFVVLASKTRAYMVPNKDETKVFVNYIPEDVTVVQDDEHYILVWKDKKTVTLTDNRGDDKHYDMTKALYVPKAQFAKDGEKTRFLCLTPEEHSELVTAAKANVELKHKAALYDKLMAEKAKRKAAREAAKKNK